MNNHNTITSSFFKTSPIAFSFISSTIGLALVDKLSVNELNSLGSFLLNIGQSLQTAAAQKQLLEDSIQEQREKNEAKMSADKLKYFEHKIKELEKNIKP